jgi:hypothetical protein
MTHTHHGARARARTQSWALTHKCDGAAHTCSGNALGLRRYWSTSAPGLRPICAATSGMVGRTWSGNLQPSCLRMQADACADRHADACANIDSYALADALAHACADS